MTSREVGSYVESQVEASEKVENNKNDIAIIGMSCRLPGKNNTPEDFYQFLLQGGDGITEVPADRWENSAYFDKDKEKANRMYVNQGGFLENIDKFDPQFFGISPKEAPHLDPQHRWLLELSYEALENAGIKSSSVKGSNTAVYIGQFMHDYEQVQLSSASHKLMTTHSATGPSMTLTANRISYTFDFTGPSVSLDTACSSSLVALDFASKAILNGDSDMAIAGGVNILLRPELTMSICKASMLSPDCRCKSFDASANGYVRSEGAGIVLLKKRSLAERDGDNILAIIKATGVNQDGQTIGITVPNGDAQKSLLQKTLQRSKLNSSAIQYAEAHGTGTAVGDPIEVNALGAVLGNRSKELPSCVIGSVKSNIGHSEATAGVAGLIKTIMSMNAGVVPHNLHYNTTNPAIDLSALNVRIAAQNTPWPDVEGHPRRAMVNSFGFGGTNANVILEQASIKNKASRKANQAPTINGKYKLLLISNKTEKGLKEQAKNFSHFLQKQIDRTNGKNEKKYEDLFHNVCYTAAVKRDHHPYRLVVIAENIHEASKALDDFIAGKPSNNYVQGVAEQRSDAKKCFVFSGMGPQWSGMGCQLYTSEPVYQQAIDECSDALKKHTKWSLVDALFHEDNQEKINDTYIAQPAIFATQYALTKLLISWGVEPDCIVGHSAGEVGAACAAGALSFDDAIDVIYHRSRLQHTTEGQGKMLAVGLSESALAKYLDGYETSISIAAINSEEALTLAGDAEGLASIAERLEEEGIFARFLNVDVPYHSPAMDQLKIPLRDALANIQSQAHRVPLYSTVSANITRTGDWGADYWPDNVREPVRFQDTIKKVAEHSVSQFIEISPHPVLASSIKEILGQSNLTSTLNRKHADDLMLQATLASLHVSGSDIDWQKLYPNGGQMVSLPNYAWQHASYWSEAEEVRTARLKNIQSGGAYKAPVHPLLGSPLKSSAALWQKSLDLNEMSYLSGHKVEDNVVYPGAAYIETALVIAHQQIANGEIEGDNGHQKPVTLENVEFLQAFFLDEESSVDIESRLSDNNNGPREFTISALDETENWQLMCRGDISDIKTQSPNDHVSLPKLIQPLSQHMDQDAFYAHCHKLGLSYNGAFKLVQQAWYEDDECVVEVHLPDTIENEFDQYLLHPVLLDGAFQGLFPTVDRGYLPVRAERFSFYKTPGKKLFCHLLTDAKDDWRIVGRLRLFDENGVILVDIKGIELKAKQSQNELVEGGIEYDYRWDAEALEPAPTPPEQGTWLVYADSKGIASTIIPSLLEKGDTVSIIDAGVAISSVEDLLPEMQSVANTCKGIIYLRSVDSPAVESTSANSILSSCYASSITPMHLVQALNQVDWGRTLDIFFITQGAARLPEDTHLPQPNQGALWGFARVFASEHAEFNIRLVDIPAPTDEHINDHLCRELHNQHYEQETALRASGRYVNRLRSVSTPILEEHANALFPKTRALETSSDNFALLEKNSTQNTDSPLILKAIDLPTPHSAEFTVTTSIATLSSESTVSGQLQIPACIGVLEARAENLITKSQESPSIGSQVVVFGVATPRSTLQPKGQYMMAKPEGFSPTQMVVCSAYFTPVYYTLFHLASLKKDETLLLDGTDIMVTSVIVPLAKLHTINVIATAKNEEEISALKRLGVENVVDISSVIQLDTLPNNIDVVICNRSGGGVQKIVEQMCPFGRFVDIRESYKAFISRITESFAEKSITYLRPNIRALATQRPEKFRGVLEEVTGLFSRGELELSLIDDLPIRACAISDTDEITNRRKSNEPLLLDFNVSSIQLARGKIDQNINVSSTYLITGGLGGLGLVVLDWLVENGAKSIALTGRSAPKSEALEKINAVKKRGVQVNIMQVDVSDHEQMTRAIDELKNLDKPLAGIVHSAGVLSDGVITQQTEEQFLKVLTPKIQGAWNLHELTLDIDLDFFICFSSIASIVGWAGQSNYAAANAFMDTLAFYRRALGKSALTVNWGPWADAGMAASLDERDIQRMRDSGMMPLHAENGMQAMSTLMSYRVPQAGVFDLDWTLILKQYADPSKKTVLSDFIDSNSANNKADFLDQLLSAKPDNYQPLLEQKISQILASILGLEDASTIDKHGNIYTYGINSLMALEFASHIQGVLKTKFSSILVMKYPTVHQLTDYLIRQVLFAQENSAVDTEKGDHAETNKIIEANQSIEIENENVVEMEW